MTTITLAAIISRLASVLDALTPALMSSTHFIRAEFENFSLREWMPAAGPQAMFRLYELEHDGRRDNLGVEDPRANRVVMTLSLVVAYPAMPKLYTGYTKRSQVNDLIASDARQIHDAINSVAAFAGPGHESSRGFEDGLERSADKKLWFKSFSVEEIFYIERTA